METQSRTPLSRDRILEAALVLADEEGVDAVTMRRLGEGLGYEAMSLYRYVKNKDDLLDGMLDLVLSETAPPASDVPWDESVRASALSVHEALRRHPWATALLNSPKHVRPARLAFMDALLRCLSDAGFSADTTYHAYHVVDGHIYGFSMWLGGHSMTTIKDPELVERLMREFSLEGYPYLSHHRDQHLADGPHREVNAFEFGLDLILDGLRKIHT
jgi:Tetracyclin repressor-like, C-terminal domain/Bacterial regulatory proteins, tetR family